MKLYYCETLNPRKACAVARHLGSPVEFVHVDLARGENRTPDFLALNPNGKVPVLQDGDKVLWESTAIMCRLSDLAGSDLWPHDVRQIEVLRWLSWDMQHFTRHGGTLYFEHLIRPYLGMGEADTGAVALATSFFKKAARVLDNHLRDHDYLVADKLSIADFATAITLPYAAAAKLPLDDFPAIRCWHGRLEELPAWREPFPPKGREALVSRPN